MIKVDYVFKNDAEVKVIKLLAHGDDRCEVCIRVHTYLCQRKLHALMRKTPGNNCLA